MRSGQGREPSRLIRFLSRELSLAPALAIGRTTADLGLIRMQSTEGVITLVQEGRFALVEDDGRVMHFVLAHGSSATGLCRGNSPAETRPA